MRDKEPVMDSIKEKLSRTPSSPGVYQMKNAAGDVIYVGKAINLKKRLASYFTKLVQPDLKTSVLVRQISTFDIIITKTEKEALILESNLIKRYRPRYNVILKDDKRYPSLKMDIRNPYPTLSIVRKIQKDHALYFGPFSSAQAVRQSLKFINKTFKLRKCSDTSFRRRSRPCLFYQMNACLAPCCRQVDKPEYNRIVKEVVLFLKGRTPDLIRKLRNDMYQASDGLFFEKAAMIRDKIMALEATLEKQVSVTTDFADKDVIGLAKADDVVLLTILFVRSGFLMGSRHFNFAQTLSTDAEIMDTFIRQYYEKAGFIPREILIQVEPDHMTAVADWLSEIKGRKTHLACPRKGEKLHLVNMAAENAENALSDLLAGNVQDIDLLHRLQKKLGLDRVPEKIECIDNSNLYGKEPVAGIVAFLKGKPDRSSYRKYKIETITRPDDYGTMAEVLTRRYVKNGGADPYPDLLMLDGGKGQLNIAVSVFRELADKQPIDIISIAKKDEEKGELQDKIYKPGRANAINFGKDVDLLFFLQTIRDEAHRFAITFHRKRRTDTALRSALDSIPGIGEKRKKVLLKHYGGIENIRAAALEELSALPGMNRNVAESVLNALKD